MYPIKHIAEITKGTWLQEQQADARIAHLLFDTRQVLFAKSALFFALKGEHHNGHDYLTDAYKQGVRSFIVSQKIVTSFPKANILFVEDALVALQALAAFHRQQFDLTCIGITGSNGKTIVKELLFQLLRHQYRIVRSPKSYNSQIGVPLSIWPMGEQHELGLFEAGISQIGEMEKLAPIVDCQIGLFTNIGPAHSEGFDSGREKIKEKLLLFRNSETVVYCVDDLEVQEAMEELRLNWAARALPLKGTPPVIPGRKKHLGKNDRGLEDTDAFQKSQKHFTWSRRRAADLQILSIEKKGHNSRIKGLFQRKEHEISVPFIDEAYLENIIHCWALLLLLRIPEQRIRERMLELEPVAMRLELKEGVNGCMIINDSYNSDLGSLRIALHFLDQQNQHKKRTLILSDILQSGHHADTLYPEIAQLIADKKIDQLIGIGPDIPIIKNFLPKQIKASFFKNTSAFLSHISVDQFQNQSILLKGAREFGFEQIAHRLSQKIHRTVLEIDLNALTHNLHVYSRSLEAGTKMMVMVKASAYGSGSTEVAKLLEFNKVDYLAVAYADEGISLRKAGIQIPIMVLNPEIHSLEQMIQYRLEPEIYSFELLESIIRLSAQSDIPIHLKLNTGMNRLGFEEEHLGTLTKKIQNNSQLKIQSIFSHLAASESPQHDDFTRLQFQRFKKYYDIIVEGLPYRPMRHILNSGGIVRFPKQQMEMVRLGIGLYGVDSSQQIQNQLEVVLTLKASISQVKTISTGDSIGYSRKGIAKGDMRTATISIGYADGLLRSAGNGRHAVSIHGQLAPIIGNVCMDMCMVDVSLIPEAKEGDEVIIFGDRPSVDDLAESLGTISYEVFTNISERVKRVYVVDG